MTGSSLKANLARAEATTGASFSATWDILSNGFKLRDSGTGSNTSGVEYAFMAFAEAPTNNLFGAQTNASTITADGDIKTKVGVGPSLGTHTHLDTAGLGPGKTTKPIS